MALTGLTNLQPNNIKVTGIATFDQTVGIAGTLTYEDVTNVDAVGLITARSGVSVSGGQVSVGAGTSLHSTGLDLGTGNITGHNIKSTGIITATSFVGNGANLTGITQTTINNNANNRLITGSGTANTLEGESNLQWDGESLYINRSSNTVEGLSISNSNNSQASAGAQLNLSGGDNSYSNIRLECNSTSHHIRQDGSGNLKFLNNTTERLRIASNGQIQVPVNGQQLTWGASQQMKFYYENSEDRMYLQGDGAYGFAIRVNSGNRLEISKTTGDITMQGASGRNFQWDNSEASLYLTDSGSGASARLKIGSGADFQLYHDVGGANHIVAANNQEIKISANKHTFYDYSGVTKRMEINASGQVTKPSNPSFHVGSPDASGAASGQVWRCHTNAIYSNVGNHYDNSNGRFTAPVAGQYFFFHWGMSNTSGQTNDVYSRKNGSRDQIGTSYNQASGAGHNQFGCSYVRTLSAGDYVDVYTGNGNVYSFSDGRHGGWGGWLIG